VVNAASRAPVVNHLWPLITQWSPSGSARVCMSVGSEPATSGSVIPTDERISPLTSGASQRCCCSAVPNPASMAESCMDTDPTAIWPQ
jgi:hypothetical protein